MSEDRVLIRDTDHLVHFASDLSASMVSEAYADVVLRCAGGSWGNNAASKSKGTGKKILEKPASLFPTIRVHRAVLASISDFLGKLIREFPGDEDVHITLDETTYEVAKRIVEFAYLGEVKISKGLVTAVCDAAHHLQVKYLKDSFVKVTDKDYAAMKVGKKSLQVVPKDASLASGTAQQQTTLTGEKRKAQGAIEPEKNPSTNSAKAKPSTKTVNQASKKSKTTESIGLTNKNDIKEGSATKQSLEKAIKPNAVTMPPVTSVQIPSPIASIQQPLPPSALSSVKKVTIPPTIRKSVGIALPKQLGGSSNPTFTLATSVGDSRILKTSEAGQVPTSFQLQTIKQPDGTNIQVLTPTQGAVLKQFITTNAAQTSPKVISTVQSHILPKDTSTGANVGKGSNTTSGASSSKPPFAIQLPKSPLPVTRVVLPTSPLPVSSLAASTKAATPSTLETIKKVVISPQTKVLSVVQSGGKPVGNQVGIVSPGQPPNQGSDDLQKQKTLNGPSVDTLTDSGLQKPNKEAGKSKGATKRQGKKAQERNKETSTPANDKDKDSTFKNGENAKVKAEENTFEEKRNTQRKVKSSQVVSPTVENNQSVRTSGRTRKSNPKYELDNGVKAEEAKQTTKQSKPSGDETKRASNPSKMNSNPKNQANKRKAEENIEEAKETPSKRSKPKQSLSEILPRTSRRSSGGASKTRGGKSKVAQENGPKLTRRQRK